MAQWLRFSEKNTRSSIFCALDLLLVAESQYQMRFLDSNKIHGKEYNGNTL